jgi:hypothetical protein
MFSISRRREPKAASPDTRSPTERTALNTDV